MSARRASERQTHSNVVSRPLLLDQGEGDTGAQSQRNRVQHEQVGADLEPGRQQGPEPGTLLSGRRRAPPRVAAVEEDRPEDAVEVQRQRLESAIDERERRAQLHESHAASAFFPSPFDESAILTLDGVGEWATASYGVGRGNRINLTHELRFPHSLGLLYSAFTYFTGFKVNSGEYKLMGLAPYGEPRYVDTILNHLIDLKPDGSFRMDMSYFRYCQGLRMTSPAFDRLFDGPPRQAEATITQREMDIAASIQAVTEEVMLRCATHVHRETGMRNLVLAGGVALNCVGNGRIVREGPFEKVWIQPASGDAGGALGVALFIWHQLLDHPRIPDPIDSQHGSLLGPVFSDDVVGDALDALDAVYRRFDDDDSLCEAVADLLASGKVVGVVSGSHGVWTESAGLAEHSG